MLLLDTLGASGGRFSSLLVGNGWGKVRARLRVNILNLGVRSGRSRHVVYRMRVMGLSVKLDLEARIDEGC